MSGDVGRATGSLTKPSYAIPPSDWTGWNAPVEFSVIDKMDNKDQHEALLDILAIPGRAAEERRQEAARRLLALRKLPRDDDQTRELALQQVRGGRLWAAAQLLDEIQDEKARLKSAAQAVVDLHANAPK